MRLYFPLYAILIFINTNKREKLKMPRNEYEFFLGTDYDKNRAITYEQNRQNKLETLENVKKGLHLDSILTAPITEDESSTCMVYRPMERKIHQESGHVFHKFKKKGAVIFPLPQGITDSVKPTWEQGSAQWKGTAIAASGLFQKSGGRRLSGKSLAATVPNQGGTPKQGGLSGFLRNLEGGIGSLVKFKGLGSEIMKQRGEIVNSHEEHYFKGVEFRSWTFTHKLVARSLEESNSINSIVDFMQFWASPRYNNGGTHIEYPAEFKIDFCHEGKPNLYLPVINQCVCEGIDINYAPDGNQFFESGASTSIEIVINMKESIIRTRDHIENAELDPNISSKRMLWDRRSSERKNMLDRASKTKENIQSNLIVKPIDLSI
jgi:hypothetical protein